MHAARTVTNGGSNSKSLRIVGLVYSIFSFSDRKNLGAL